MKFMLLTIFFASQSTFCAQTKKSQVIVVEKLHKKHDGPPLFVSDIYINGKPDKDFHCFLKVQKKYYPLLTETEIIDCVEYCGRLKDKEHDIIQELQDLELWKATHLDEIKDKQTCFEEYKRQR